MNKATAQAAIASLAATVTRENFQPLGTAPYTDEDRRVERHG